MWLSPPGARSHSCSAQRPLLTVPLSSSPPGPFPSPPRPRCWGPRAVHLGTGHCDSSPVTSTQGHRGTALPGLRRPFPPLLRGCPCPSKGPSAGLVSNLQTRSDRGHHRLQLTALHLPLVTSFGNAPQATLSYFHEEKNTSTGGQGYDPPSSSVRKWLHARAVTGRVTAGRGPGRVPSPLGSGSQAAGRYMYVSPRPLLFLFSFSGCTVG